MRPSAWCRAVVVPAPVVASWSCAHGASRVRRPSATWRCRGTPPPARPTGRRAAAARTPGLSGPQQQSRGRSLEVVGADRRSGRRSRAAARPARRAAAARRRVPRRAGRRGSGTAARRSPRPGCRWSTIRPSCMIASRSASVLGLLQVVRGQQHRRAAVAQGAHQLPGVPAPFGVQSGGRLVEEEHLGPAEQGERQVQPPPLAAGELLDPYAGPRRPARPAPAPPRPGRAPLVHPAHIRAVSATVSSEGKPPSWSITPIRGRTAARSRYGSWPRTRTRPPVGAASPSSSSTVEVLPAPFVPSSAKSSPRATEKRDLRRTASNPPPYTRRSRSTSITCSCPSVSMPSAFRPDGAGGSARCHQPRMTNVIGAAERLGGADGRETRRPRSDRPGPHSLSGRRGSNSRPQPWQGCALPTELRPHCLRPALTDRRAHHST